jgi:hypothetical protein
MMCENSRMSSKHATTLQFLLEISKIPTIVYPHEFCFEKTLNRVSSHIHPATPPDGVEQSACIVEAMLACLGLFTYTRV